MTTQEGRGGDVRIYGAGIRHSAISVPRFVTPMPPWSSSVVTMSREPGGDVTGADPFDSCWVRCIFADDSGLPCSFVTGHDTVLRPLRGLITRGKDPGGQGARHGVSAHPGVVPALCFPGGRAR